MTNVKCQINVKYSMKEMKKKFNTLEEAIADIRNGKMVIVVDDQGRENEGDLIIAAEKVTPAAINFMITEGKGLVCVPLAAERLRVVRRINERAAQGRQPRPVLERRADRVGQQACLGDRQSRGRQAQRDADREVKPSSPSDPEEAGIDGPQAPAPVSSGGIWFTPIRRRKTQ